MDKQKLNLSCRQLSKQCLRATANTALPPTFVQLATLFSILALSAQSFAATQGDWGSSSTASAKITLRILPRDHGGPDSPTKALADAKGHNALQAYCGSSSPFNQPAKLFTAKLLQEEEGQQDAMDLDRALRGSCEGNYPAIGSAQPRTNPDSDQLVVVISPI